MFWGKVETERTMNEKKQKPMINDSQKNVSMKGLTKKKEIHSIKSNL